jgi:pantothenate kinase
MAAFCLLSLSTASPPRGAVRAAEQLTKRVCARAAGAPRYLLGIAGVPGSGKTTTAALLAEMMPASLRAATISMDGWHIPRARLDAVGVRRRGAPFTFDAAAFAGALEEIRAAQGDVFVDTFSHADGDPVRGGGVVPVDSKVVIVEGNYLLLRTTNEWRRVGDLLDDIVYIDVDIDEAMTRVAERHCRKSKRAQSISQNVQLARDRLRLSASRTNQPDLCVPLSALLCLQARWA